MVIYLVLDATGYPIAAFSTLLKARAYIAKFGFSGWRCMSIHVDYVPSE